jgi:adenine-specific DNA-methyltransferase
LSGPPTFDQLLGASPFASTTARSNPLQAVLDHFNTRARLEDGLIFRQFSDGGPAGRLFFTGENGRRIDSVIATLKEWIGEGWITRDERDVLLASLIDAADRVANTSGVYGAFLKTFQRNAQKPLELLPPPIVSGPAAQVFNEDGNQLVRRLNADVVYIDPPYNQRQYPKNYHVPEVIAELSDVVDVVSYEAQIRGKTGLLPFEDRRSDYCKKAKCAGVFTDLLLHARTEHILVSYSEEGILSADEIAAALTAACGPEGFSQVVIDHKRFRSDTDRGGRNYHQVEGRNRDRVGEWLFHARKAAAPMVV